MTVVSEPEEAVLVAQDVADLMALAHKRTDDSPLLAVVAQMVERHRQSAVKFSTAAQLLDISTTTVTTWVRRGVLEEVKTGGVRRVSSVSLGKILAFLRIVGKPGPNRRERILRAIERLRDQDLLERAREAAGEHEMLRYDEAALRELRNAQ